MPGTHYDTLGVTPTAPDAVVRAAYKTLMQGVHPDRHGADRQAWAHAETLKLTAAFEVLSDPKRRQAYNETLSWRHTATPQDDGSQERVSQAILQACRHWSSKASEGARFWAQAAQEAQAHPQTRGFSQRMGYRHELHNPTNRDWLIEFRDPMNQLLERRLLGAGKRLTVMLPKAAATLLWADNARSVGGTRYEADPWKRLTLVSTSGNVTPSGQESQSEAQPLWPEVKAVLHSHGWWLMALGLGGGWLMNLWMS